METARKPGRPAGLTKASGAKVSPGRPAALTASEQARYQHWRTWWQGRKQAGSTLTATALARQMEQTTRLVQLYAAGTRGPGPVALANLESLSAAHGYEPLTADHLFL